MRLKCILTTRHLEKPVHWQIVREWEDAIAKRLDLPLVNQQTHLFGEQANRVDRVLFRKSLFPFSEPLLGRNNLPALCFHMNPPHVRGYHTRRDVIPVVIDCWRDDIGRVPEMFGRHKAIFVCNLESVRILKALSPSLPVFYLPVSIPRSYIPSEAPEKDIDILCYSRTHPDLYQWAHQYTSEHPEIRFCWTGVHEGRPFLHEKGQKTELGHSRQAVLDILARSKVVLQSSPGMHAQEFARTGGLNPITPRFLEAAASCCFMVGIFPNNEEFERMRIKDVCRQVTTYGEFSESVSDLLAMPFGSVELSRYRNFLARNSTEERADEIRRVLETAGAIDLSQ